MKTDPIKHTTRNYVNLDETRGLILIAFAVACMACWVLSSVFASGH